LTLTFMFDLLTENFNLRRIFWMVCIMILIQVFLETVSSHGYQKIWHCDLDLDVWPTYWKYNFWLVCTRTLIFLMTVSCDKMFSWLIFLMTVSCDKTFPWLVMSLL
jgi:hypothetical protein